MKALNLLALQHVSGGENFLISTSIVDIEAIPNTCIERFFNGTISSNALVGLTPENLISTLTNGCIDYNKSKFSSDSEADLTILRLEVI